MKRNHSAFSTRSASPAGPPNLRPTRGREEVSQLDGPCLGKPDAVSDSDIPPRPAAVFPPKQNLLALDPTPTPTVDDGQTRLPYFLRLTEDEIHDKFVELIALENERLSVKHTSADTDHEWARLDADPVLDRYSNIQPWANNRILLQVPDGINSYINASPIALVSTAEKQSALKAGIQDKYICMQGPKRETVDHTWHMIWHELSDPYETSPAVVIMLTPTRVPHPSRGSGTVEKCFAYFPEDESSGPLVINESNALGEEFHAEVRFVKKEPPIPGSTLEVRELAMTVRGEEGEKPIWHFMYPSWPDFGALEEKNVASIIALMKLSRAKNGPCENPRIVHCSAGVGRTGTFVALEFLISELHGGAWDGYKGKGDPIYDTVNQLRMQRRNMVQAYEQYQFLYQVMRKMWEEKYIYGYAGDEAARKIVEYDTEGLALGDYRSPNNAAKHGSHNQGLANPEHDHALGVDFEEVSKSEKTKVNVCGPGKGDLNVCAPEEATDNGTCG